MNWTVRGLNPGGGQIFSFSSTPMYTRSFRGTRRTESTEEHPLLLELRLRVGWSSTSAWPLRPHTHVMCDPYLYPYLFTVHLAWWEIFTQTRIKICSKLRHHHRSRPKTPKWMGSRCLQPESSSLLARLTTSAEYKNETLDICDFEICASFQVITAVAFISSAMCHWASSSGHCEAAWCFRNVSNKSTPYNILETVLKSCFFGSNWLFNKTPMGWIVWRS